MIKQLNTAKNGKLALYVALLVLVVLLMVGIKNCGSKITVKSPTPAKSGGDTLDVAIEYSITPMPTRSAASTTTCCASSLSAWTGP